MNEKIARPLSRAYKSLDLNANNDLSIEEEAVAKQAYHANRGEKAVSLGEMFKEKMRESLNDCGRYKSVTVDQELKQVDPENDLPEELKQAYVEMLRTGIKARLIEDQDYQALKDSGRYEFLRRL